MTYILVSVLGTDYCGGKNQLSTGLQRAKGKYSTYSLIMESFFLKKVFLI